MRKQGGGRREEGGGASVDGDQRATVNGPCLAPSPLPSPPSPSGGASPPTLRDLADACGCDVSTVSRAVRDDPRIAAPTRERVQAAARRLGYRPNLLARQLRTGRTGAVWLVLDGLASPISYEPADAASRFCQARGASLLAACHHGDRAARDRLLAQARQGLCDAVLIAASGVDAGDPAPLHELAACGFPLAFLDRHLDGVAAPAFTTANADAAAGLVRRLHAAGATAVVSTFGDPNTAERARAAGVAAGCAAGGLPLLRPTDTVPDGVLAVIANGEPQVRALLRERPEWAGRRLLAGVFDAWDGEAAPLQQVEVCLQDFTAMAEAAAGYLLARCDGAPAQAGVQAVAPRGWRTVLPERPTSGRES